MEGADAWLGADGVRQNSTANVSHTSSGLSLKYGGVNVNAIRNGETTMNSKQQQTVNESQRPLWQILPSEDDVSVSLPYNGSSGWSGTDTSKERAATADANGDTKKRQLTTIGHLLNTQENGLTWKELSFLTGWHHGTASGALSVLHKDQRIARLTEKRDRCRVYVLPEYVNGRDTDEQGRKHQCPKCGHRF